MAKGKGKPETSAPTNSKAAVKSYVKRMTSVYEHLAEHTDIRRGAHMKRRQPEAEMQKAVVAFLDLALPRSVGLALAIPNGGKRSPIEAAIMAGMGVRRGAADLLVLWTCPGFVRPAIGFIELKATKGKLSVDQEVFARRVKAIGAHWAEARSVEEVERHLRAWGCPLSATVMPRGTVLEAA